MSDPDSIVVVQDYLRVGGTERQSLHLTGTLHRAGCRTHLVIFRPGGALAGDLDGLPHTVLQRRDTGLDFYAPRLVATLRGLRPAAVLCMGFNANYYAGWLQARLPDTDVVGTVRTGRSLPAAYRWSLRRVRRVHVNTEWWKRELVDRLALAPERVHVVHNPLVVDPGAARRGDGADRLRAAHGVPPEACLFLCVQAFRKGKDHDVLLRAFAASAGTPAPRLWLVGDGVERRRCERLAAALGISDRVRFLGLHTDPAPYYLAADVAVTASRRDSLPNFLIEAQAFGLPVVAVEHMGVAEAFEPERSGLLVPAGAPAALAGAITRLAGDAALRRRMGERGAVSCAERFDPERQVERTLAALGRERPGAPLG